MTRLPGLPRAGAVTAAALVLVAAGTLASVLVLDLQVEFQLSELQAYAAGDIVDRMTLLQRDSGPAGLLQAVGHATETAAPGQVFLLTDPQGARLAGNLPQWPHELGGDDDWRPFGLADDRGARAITATMPDGERLLVGEADDSRHQVRRSIITSAVLTFGCLTLALLGVAAVWGRLISARLATLAGAARAIARGERETRVAVARPRDGFDAVALAFNQMVDENLHLIGGLEAVTHSLAHDVRTPLMRMQAAIADARAAQDPADQAAALDRAEREAERAVAIFTALTDLARAESGVSREAMQTLDVAELLQDVVELFEPLAEERGQALRLQTEPLLLRAHRQLLFQAVGNLIMNALRYGPERAPIDITLRRSRRGAEIVVRDYGSGLTEAEAAEVVRPFVRLQSGGAADGLGLGLAIVQAVAQLHGGALALRPAHPGLQAVLDLQTNPP